MSLLRPTSPGQQGPHFPSPIFFRLEPAQFEGRPAISGRMILWGRRAQGLSSLALAALETTGRRGLLSEGTAVRFDVYTTKVFDGTLRRWNGEQFSSGVPREVVLEFAEPCSSPAMPPDAETVDVARLVGEAAYQLASWDLVDRGESDRLGEAACDLLASQARDAARETLSGLSPERCVLGWRSLGARRSGTNPGTVRLEGAVGYARLAGDLSPALPWLSLLPLRGAGGRTSLGLGRVELWVPPKEPAHTPARPLSAAEARPRGILLLVGAQRIPNAIPVMMEPGLREAVLLSTGDLDQAEEDLRLWLRSRGLSVSILRVDPHDYGSLRASLATVFPLYEPGALLVNVTGGTKIMSLAAADAAREHGHRAIYVDTQHGLVREIHPGSANAPLVARFRVQDFFTLHGQPWRPAPKPSARLRALARAIGRGFPAAFDLIDRLRGPDGSEVALRPGEEGLARLCLDAGILNRSGTGLAVRDGTFFVQNEWLECLAFAACEDAGCDDVEWRTPVEGTVTDFDVVATKGPILLVVSCKSGRAVRGDELDKLEAQSRRVGGSFCRRLFLRVEAGDWKLRGSDAVAHARAAFDDRARSLGIVTLYWEAFRQLAERIKTLVAEAPEGRTKSLP